MRPTRAEAPGTPYRLRLSPDEQRTLREAARVNGQGMADFVRQSALDAAAECGVQLPARPAAGRQAVRIMTPAGLT